jgi:hypothetical protein
VNISIEPFDITTVNITALPWVAANNLNALPPRSGLYFIVDETADLLYLGQSIHLKNRLTSGHHKLSFLRTVGCQRIYWLPVAEDHLVQMEGHAIQHFKPRWNGIHTPEMSGAEHKGAMSDEAPCGRGTYDRLWHYKRTAAACLCYGRAKNLPYLGELLHAMLMVTDETSYAEHSILKSDIDLELAEELLQLEKATIVSALFLCIEDGILAVEKPDAQGQPWVVTFYVSKLRSYLWPGAE